MTISTDNTQSDKYGLIREHITNGGRIFRRRQGRRTITVAYRQTETGDILYGATIHTKNSPAENFIRRDHNLTAVQRLTHAPVKVSDGEFVRPEHREDYLRECLFTHGCFRDDQTWLHPHAVASSRSADE